MPNTVPPRRAPRPAHHRTQATSPPTAAPAAPTGRRGTSTAPAAPATDTLPTARTGGVPASWAGAGALLAAAAPVLPGPEAVLNPALLGTATQSAVSPDLSGLWSRPAEPAKTHSRLSLRRVETKSGRIPLSLRGIEAETLLAARDGAVLRIYLPDATTAPAPGSSVAAPSLDDRGRVILGEHVCAELGIGTGTDVLVLCDPVGRTLDLCAASRIESAVAASIDAQRASAARRGGTTAEAVSDDEDLAPSPQLRRSAPPGAKDSAQVIALRDPTRTGAR